MSVQTKIPFSDYCQIEAVNASSLLDLRISAHNYRYRRDQPRDDSDTFRVGRASHTAILEPDRFLLEYTVYRGKRRYGKDWDAFRDVHEGQTILTIKQYETALQLRDAARAHPIAAALLAEPGRPELTIEWVHPRTGLKCKSRVDWLCSALVDVKTTRNPDPGKFAGDMARYGYHIQLAFYADAVAAATEMGALPVKILAVQNVAPLDVVVFDLPEDLLQAGRNEYEELIDRLIVCRETNKWPGLAHDGPVDLHLPAWAAPEPEEQELTFGGQPISF